MTRPPDDNTPPDAPHAPGTHTDPQRDGSSEAAGEERADSLREPQSYGEAAAWKLVQEVRWQRDERKAECERRGEENAELRRQLDSCHERAADLAGHYRQLVQERNEARAECERLVRRDGELTAALERRGEEVHRRLLDILGWESGTEEQTLEALAGAVRAARGDRTHKDVYQQRNEARAECERLRRELRAAREAVGEGWFTGGATLAEAIRRKVHVLECERENRLADKHQPAPVEDTEGGAR